MMGTRSLCARIVAGFMACVAVSGIAFGLLMAIGVQFRSAETGSREAVGASRAAADLGQRAANARVALYRYLYSVAESDRQALDAELAGIAGTAGGGALTDASKAASELIQKSQIGAVGLLGSSSNVASSLAAAGELAASFPDPAASAAVARAAQAFALLAIDVGRLVAIHDERAGDTIKDSVARVTAALKELQAVPGATARMKKIAGSVSGDVETLAVSVNTYRAVSKDRAAALDDLRAKFDGVAAEVKVRLAASDQAFAAASAETASASQRMLTSLVVSGVTVLVIGIVLAVTIGRSITRPILGLTTTMGRLSDGDFDAKVSGQERKDEIGAMARAVDVFKANGVALRDTEQARATAVQEQAEAVSAIGAGLARLAEGDLTCRLEQTFPDAYRKLQDDFNAAMQRLHATMQKVATATNGLRAATGGITTVAEDLARRTETQASSLEQTAVALEEITTTVGKTAEGASHARSVTASSKADAERSAEVVDSTIAAMAEIERSSQQIAEITGVIDEIASQTGLLALNAGIEAARAGDEGRGFAVVASEVRSLARRSAEAAKTIKSLIDASRQQVGTGVELVSHAGQALQRITGQVADINLAVSEIAGAAREQASALAHVNTAVAQMDQVTRRNATMVEDASASTRVLAREAEELTRLVGHFKVTPQKSETPPKSQATQKSPPVRARMVEVV